MLRRVSIAVVLAGLGACSEDEPPGGNAPADSGVGGTLACDIDHPCPGGFRCSSGLCEPRTPDDAGSDAGPPPRAELEVCTAAGECMSPHQVSFGGSRIGVETQRTLTLRATGELPVELRSIDILGQNSEFRADPSGDVDLVLAPGEELAIRVTHAARDGIEDKETLQIVSSAERARILIELSTDYKGVPSLFVGESPLVGNGVLTTLDFGNVRGGTTDTRVIYLRNKDPVRDGSILTIEELRIDPASSTNFVVTPDDSIPVYLNQFGSTCANDSACNTALGDTCDQVLGVCRTSAARIRDVITASVTFIGQTPGLIEERLIVLSNDGGASHVQTPIILRARVVFSALEVTPDPIAFAEAYVGFTHRQSVTIENTGTAPVTLTRFSLAPVAPFGLDLDAATLPWTLAPMAQRTFDVTYAPTTAGVDSAALTIESSDLGTPIMPISVSGTAFVAPEIDLSITRADFGNVHQSETKTILVTVTNRGGSDLRIPSIARSGTTAATFSVDPVALPPIPAAGSQTFNVRYSPVSSTYPTGEGGVVMLTSNDPARPSSAVTLAGRGVNPEARLFPAPPYNFNDQPTNPNRPTIYAGQTVSISVELSNPGIGPLELSSLVIDGDVRGAFSLVNAPSLPLSLVGNQRLTLAIRYTPNAVGTDGAELRFTTNDADLGTRTGVLVASLVGSAVGCPTRPNTTGTSDPSGACTYTCLSNWHDIDGNTANGCEYGCQYVAAADAPDDAFADANCDGIDGIATEAVFVAPSPVGNDSNAGTMSAPMATIPNAMQATTSSRRAVYVSQGTYAGPISLTNGISLYGGYDATDRWSRAVDHATTIVGQSGLGVEARSITQRTIIDRFQILAGNATTPGSNSVGIYVFNSNSALEIRNCTIVAGNGANGRDADNGTTGATGSDGAAGQQGCDACSANGAGGTGGASSCGNSGGRGGAGGHDNAQGSSGSRGNGTSGGSYGTGGRGAEACDSELCASCGRRLRGEKGTAGTAGSTGQTGTQGGGGTGRGSVPSNDWVGASGQDGSTGVSGNAGGGGGGGGGGADECYEDIGVCFSVSTCYADRGGGGGGGGGGGCGGSGGKGGQGGGGSFGVFLRSSSATIVGSTVRAGTGGRGGRGGDG